ncbi:thiamine diphosphokinase [Laceyella tengchongensis]|uniref:Thiamine diphosphokinase n=1 Tax=Laceyella tengchongensis TaxID=574699 RepID=A0AA45WL98_9BACL|nr:thiamine diphosphokinase [Laceyella tengchongensis]MRG28971.1 thiamine diphosphokinase [Laceyella tengchongensis]SMP10083.1 thiamine pyrophosphokinase [Laceyella tengchongensis]
MSRQPRVYVVAGGEVTEEELMVIQVEPGFVITADAGAQALLRMGMKPDLAVGDFDTTGRGFVGELARLEVSTEALPAEKAVTDLHFALIKAIERRPDEVRILGALGGQRYDHMLANIALLEWLAEQGVRGVLLHRTNRIRLLVGPGRLSLPRQGFQYVSLIPLSKEVRGVRTVGLKYPLHGETLHRIESRGISNEWSDAEAMVAIQTGKLLVVESREGLVP